MRLPLNEKYDGFYEEDFDWSDAQEIGKDEIGRMWWFVGDRENGNVFYAIYPVGEDEWAILKDYWLTDDDEYTSQDWIDLYNDAVEDAQESDQWYGEV